MKRLMTAFLAACSTAACAGVATPRADVVTAGDLHRAVGDTWRGTLTYRDYSPPFADVTLDVEAKITPLPDGISVSFHYPREPQADSVTQTLISDSGARVDGARVIARKETGETLTISTEEACQDDDRPAICAHEYVMSPARLTWVKRVKFEGEAAFTRNTFTFSR